MELTLIKETNMPNTPMKKIFVTFQKAGVHRYPNAPFDVNYLQHPHRHLFKFKITIAVFHDDREVEFHQFLNWLESLYAGHLLDADSKSCEMLSDDLYTWIAGKYPDRFVEIEISEDGECGAICTYPGRGV